MRYRSVSSFLPFVVLLVILAGCTAAAPVPPAATPSPLPPTLASTTTLTSAPTTPSATVTSTATALPPSPTVTQTAIPSATATATILPTPTSTPTVTPKPGAAIPGAYGAKTGVVIYMIAENTGGPICGDTAVPVPVNIPRTKDTAADIEAALDRLFSLKNKYYGSLYNPVSFSTLRVQDVEYSESGGGLTVWLSGKYHPTGDDCDNTRVKAQIWNTAKQFGGITGTAFYINGPHPFGDFVSNDK